MKKGHPISSGPTITCPRSEPFPKSSDLNLNVSDAILSSDLVALQGEIGDTAWALS